MKRFHNWHSLSERCRIGELSKDTNHCFELFMSMAPWAFQSLLEPGRFTALGIGISGFSEFLKTSTQTSKNLRVFHLWLLRFTEDCCPSLGTSTPQGSSTTATRKLWVHQISPQNSGFIESVECLEYFWSAFDHTPSGCCHWPCCDSHRFRTRTEACSCNRGTTDLARTQ